MSSELNGQFDGSVRRWRRHPAYKDSGLHWSLEIPAHWEMRRLKDVAIVRPSNVDKKSVEGEKTVRLCNYVDVYKNDYITDSLDFMPATATVSQIATFALRSGDVIITKDSESWDDIAVPAYVPGSLDGVVCGYHLALIRANPKKIDGEYLFRCFIAEGICDQFRIAANGITRFGLGTEAITKALFPVPSLDEQRGIVAFLAAKTAKIDALIAKKQRLIELLAEKRTALVSHAVTKGIDPSVPMKDSGVGWLGSIPAYWDVSNLGRYVLGIEQGWSPVADERLAEDGEWGVIKLGAVYKGRFRSAEHKALPVGLKPDERYEVREGDFLLTRANTPDLVGDVCVVQSPRPRLMLCDLVYRLRLNEGRINKHFVTHWLLSVGGRYQITRDTRGSSQSMVKLAQGHIGRLTILLPPISEQKAIVAVLDSQTAKIDALIVKVRQAIDSLREYRTALISAAATGKIDVRQEAKK